MSKFEIDNSLKVGDLVFFNCSNPAVGIVRHITKKKDKVDIQFFEGASCNINKTYRHKVSSVSLLNPVLNRHLIDNKIIEDNFKGMKEYSYFVFTKAQGRMDAYWKGKCELCRFSKGDWEWWICLKADRPMTQVKTENICGSGYYAKSKRCLKQIKKNEGKKHG